MAPEGNLPNRARDGNATATYGDLLLRLVRLSVDRVLLTCCRDEILPECERAASVLRRRRLSSVPYLGTTEVPGTVAAERQLWAMQRSHLLQLLEVCRGRGIRVTVTKGAEMCERFFGSEPLGRKGDVDVLVAREDEDRIRAVLQELGFSQSNFDPESMALVRCSREELQRHEANGYNLKSFAKLVDLAGTPAAAYAAEMRYPMFASGDKAVALVIVDVSFGFDRTVEVAPILARTVPSRFAGAETISMEDHLWQLCAHFYLKTFILQRQVKLSLLCEIAAILWFERAGLDWDYLERISSRYGLYPYLYYNLAFLDVLLGLQLPRNLLNAFDPRRGSRLRDFGWPLPRALGELDAFPRDLIPASLLPSVTEFVSLERVV